MKKFLKALLTSAVLSGTIIVIQAVTPIAVRIAGLGGEQTRGFPATMVEYGGSDHGYFDSATGLGNDFSPPTGSVDLGSNIEIGGVIFNFLFFFIVILLFISIFILIQHLIKKSRKKRNTLR